MIARTCRADDPAIRRICGSCGSKNVKDAFAYIRFVAFRQRDVLCEVIDETAFYVCYFGKGHCRLVELACDELSHGNGYGTAALMRIRAACEDRGIPKMTFRCSESEGFAGFYIRHGAVITGRRGGDYEMELEWEDYIA